LAPAVSKNDRSFSIFGGVGQTLAVGFGKLRGKAKRPAKTVILCGFPKLRSAAYQVFDLTLPAGFPATRWDSLQNQRDMSIT
jgi:hypothetical protein